MYPLSFLEYKCNGQIYRSFQIEFNPVSSALPYPGSSDHFFGHRKISVGPNKWSFRNIGNSCRAAGKNFFSPDAKINTPQ
jgi:hypothetical protein